MASLSGAIGELPSMSYEPWRSRAYDSDLKWRMIYQRKVLEYSPKRVSENLLPTVFCERAECLSKDSTIHKSCYLWYS